MDLSKIPTEDLQHIQAGNWEKVSTQGLQEYQAQRQHVAQAQQQAANPPVQPDAADKAARPKQDYMSPGESATNNYWTNIKARVADPERYKAIAGMQSPAKQEVVGDDLGAANLAIPMEAAPPALGKLASYLGGSGFGPAAGRIVANAGIGAIHGGAEGALKGAALASGAEAIGGLVSGGGGVISTSRMAMNPSKTQDQAIAAIDDATGKLKSSEAENLAKYLGDKTLSIDTTRIRAINPEIDSILSTHASKVSPYGDIPSQLEIPAQEANKIRSLLDQEMTYKKLGPYAQTAETAARDAQIKPLADQIRSQIHGMSPDVSNTLDQWSDNLNAARNLDKRAESAPMTVLSSPSFDRRALLQKVDEQAGTDLRGLGTKITNAKVLSNSFHNGVHPLDALGVLLRSAGQGAVKGNKVALPIEAAGQGLFQKQE